MKHWALLGFCATVLLAGCAPSPVELRTQGISEFQLGRTEEAQKLLQQTLDLTPSDPEALYYMGRINHVQGFYEQAFYYYQCALDVDPSFEPARKWLARAQELLGPTGKTLRFLP